MCEVSGSLQLCSCSGDIDNLKHYWVLYRFIQGKKHIVIGMVLPPYFIDPVVDDLNREQLLLLLNEGNAFDFDITLNKKDRLVISFGIGNANSERINYGFTYHNNSWQQLEYDPLEWRWNHEETEKGKIKNALKRKREKEQFK
ncbi:MAG TPA: hypothetical protein PKM63_05905 [Panacibacter sp.]|nr:hypothetical protein [Panacibacter sp.]HNP43799.1 hypothetical protein [Panacibacter sp.]